MTTVRSARRTVVAVVEDNKVLLKDKSFLGFIKWQEIISTTKISSDIVIITDEVFDKIIVNGQEYEKKALDNRR